jgi:hypothetical protein
VSHRYAPLSELGRMRLARCVVDDGWPLRRAAERFQVSATTDKRWADRYRTVGTAGMSDRSSRPHRNPNRTPTRTERRIIKVRLLRRWGPARIAYLLGLHPSTVHRVLARYRMVRLRWLDRATAAPVRRYEHSAPGDLVHVDIKKLGNIPDGGGHRVVGRRAGARNRTSTPGKTLRNNGKSHVGCSYLHNAVDDHSRLACSETLPDERKETAAPCSRNGPTPTPAGPKPNAAPHSPTGSTPTITVSPPRPHRTRRTPTSQPRPQPLFRSVHLGCVAGCARCCISVAAPKSSGGVRSHGFEECLDEGVGVFGV